jgi:hypothetical protein
LKKYPLKKVEETESIMELFKKNIASYPKKSIHGDQNEYVTGDYIYNCKNSQNIFNSNYVEDSKYIIYGNHADCCQDAYVAVDDTELSYEVVSSIGQYQCGFTYSCWHNSNIYYCDHCQDSSDLFGCAGLRHNKYCILNRQYTKEEYEKLVPRIIEHMKKTSEWGEFFPMGLTPFDYNETAAIEYFPLSYEKAAKHGLKWKEEEQAVKYQGKYENVSYDIDKAKSDIINEILECVTCGKNYKIMRQEFDLCKKMEISLPRNCFNCRYKTRLQFFNPRKLWDRKCSKCGAKIVTTYAPDRPESVYCEKCYLETVY